MFHLQLHLPEILTIKVFCSYIIFYVSQASNKRKKLNFV